MRVSEHWLRDCIDIPLSIQALANQLTYAGIEVESIEPVENQPDNSIITFKIPPNRGDCLSVEGIVRELSVLNAQHSKAINSNQQIPYANDLLTVKVEASHACSRYVGRVIKNINAKAETPTWMQKRLLDADIRLVSPVVDVTNYVMIELGQPLHAFDLAKVNTHIIVRFAKKGEVLMLLDGQNIVLDTDTLIIADQEKPLAIAGIMGGQASSVQTSTQSIFLESAYFNPITIRLAARRYGLRTDSSFRFERTVDPALQVRALERATELLVEIVGGVVCPLIEFYDKSYHPQPLTLELRRKQVSAILGIELSDKEITDILTRLEMQLEVIPLGWRVLVPSFRSDIVLEIDLIEEIVRIFGLQALSSQRLSLPFNVIAMPEVGLPIVSLKKMMIDRGYTEAITYSFVDKMLLELIDPTNKPLTLVNPISEQAGAMRTTLWVGLLQALQYNERRQQSRIRLFEVGLQFPEQRQMLAGVAMGSVMPLQWGASSQEVDFYDMKADIEALVKMTRQEDTLRFESTLHAALHPGKSALIYLRNQLVGKIGVVHPKILKALGLVSPVVIFELELGCLVHPSLPMFKSLSKYPSIRRDLAIIVGQEVLASAIKSAIVKQVGDWLQAVTVFDVYQGKGIVAGKKSMALTLCLQHPSRTLIEEEVNQLVHGVLQCLEHHFQATLRE